MQTAKTLLGLGTHIQKTLLQFLWHNFLPLDKSNVFKSWRPCCCSCMIFHCKDRKCFLHLHSSFCPPVPRESAQQSWKMVLLPYRSMHQAQHTLTWPVLILLTSAHLFVSWNSSVLWLITAEWLPRFSLQYALQPAKWILFLEINEDVKSSKTLTFRTKFANWAEL